VIRMRRNPWSRVTSATADETFASFLERGRAVWRLTLECEHEAVRRRVKGKPAPTRVRCETCGNPGGAK